MRSSGGYNARADEEEEAEEEEEEEEEEDMHWRLRHTRRYYKKLHTNT
jgi:hypothetical protein